MTDTVPKAITQADREAAADYYGAHMGGGPNYLSYIRNSATGDTNPLVQAFARHRRLASQDAGEGLREAARQVCEALMLEYDDAAPTVAILGIAATRIGALPLTPPSDAGSTTPSGGPNPTNAMDLLHLAARFGPLLKQAFPEAHTITRGQVGEALSEVALLFRAGRTPGKNGEDHEQGNRNHSRGASEGAGAADRSGATGHDAGAGRGGSGEVRGVPEVTGGPQSDTASAAAPLGKGG